jgi:hypothetical protein
MICMRRIRRLITILRMVYIRFRSVFERLNRL